MKHIPLTRGQFVIVDDDDYENLNQFKWSAHWNWNTGSYYAERHGPKINGKQSTILMHRLIAETPKGMITDHINGDTLDNRRCNLRIVTASQNQRNQYRNRNAKPATL